MNAPKDLVDQSVHQFFVMVMTFRHTGLADLKPSLMNALEVQDTEVAAEQISRAHVLSDQLGLPVHGGVRLQGDGDPQGEEPRRGHGPHHTIPDRSRSRFPVPGASRSSRKLKSTGNLQAVHGVAVAKVGSQPDEKEINSGGTYNLTVQRRSWPSW